jgi:hypothetical protein
MPKYLAVVLAVALVLTVGGVVAVNHAGTHALTALGGAPAPPIPPGTLTALGGAPAPPIPPGILVALGGAPAPPIPPGTLAS